MASTILKPLAVPLINRIRRLAGCQPLTRSDTNDPDATSSEDDDSDIVHERLSRLEKDGLKFRRFGYFQTPVCPAVAFRESILSLSLLIWTIWTVVLFCGWWASTSPINYPIDRAGIRNLQQSVDQISTDAANSASSVVVPFKTVSECFQEARRHTSSVILLPLCNDGGFSESFFSSFSASVPPGPSSGYPLSPASLMASTQSVFELASDQASFDRFCGDKSGGSPPSDLTDRALVLLKSVYRQLDALWDKPDKTTGHPSGPIYFVLYHSSLSSVSVNLYLSDLPIALVSAPSQSTLPSDTFRAATTVLFSTWFEPRTTSKTASAPIALLKPKYVWRFLLVGDGKRRISWNFETEVLDNLLQPFLASFRKLADVEISSHVGVANVFECRVSLCVSLFPLHSHQQS